MRLNGPLVPDNCRRCGALIAVHPMRLGSPNYCPVHRDEVRKETRKAAKQAARERQWPGGRSETKTVRCVDCGDPVLIHKMGRAEDARCPTHAAERKRQMDAAGKRRRAAQRLVEESKRAGTYARKTSSCKSCGLPYRPLPGDPPDCAVCVYEKMKASGQTDRRLGKKAIDLRRARVEAALPKPPPGRCVVCGVPAKNWYCSDEHRRTGYKLLAAAEEELRDLASAFESPAMGPVWDPDIGHKGGYRPNRKRRRRRRRWARVF